MDRSNWFIQHAGKVSGPLTADHIRRLISDQFADQSVLVIKEGWNGWQSLSDIRRTFAVETQSAPKSNTLSIPAAPATADWFVSINGKQIGPMDERQMKMALSQQAEKSRTYVIHRTWREWKAAQEVFQQPQAQVSPQVPVPAPASIERKAVAQLTSVASPSVAGRPGEKRSTPSRAAVVGQVILHNDQALVSTEAWNISESGIALRCIEKPFAIGEIVKLTLKCPGMGAAFHVIGRVARYNSNGDSGAGFAVQFIGVAATAKSLIVRYVSERAPKSIGVAS